MSPRLHKAKLVKEFFRESGIVIMMARDMNLDKHLKNICRSLIFAILSSPDILPRFILV